VRELASFRGKFDLGDIRCPTGTAPWPASGFH